MQHAVLYTSKPMDGALYYCRPIAAVPGPHSRMTLSSCLVSRIESSNVLFLADGISSAGSISRCAAHDGGSISMEPRATGRERRTRAVPTPLPTHRWRVFVPQHSAPTYATDPTLPIWQKETNCLSRIISIGQIYKTQIFRMMQ